MVIFPNAKINIGLRITGKRNDGFHNLETIFYPIKLYDVLEVIESSSSGEYLHFQTSGLEIDSSQDNICKTAFQLLKKDFPSLPNVTMHLHKAIPMGAGMGGGSADGAFALMLLNNKFNLGLTSGQLSGYALTLGSDCPFFILNKPALAKGRGELLQPVSLDLSGYNMVIINPGIFISTSTAFSQLKEFSSPSSPEKLIAQPVNEWKDVILNDFEAGAFASHPALKEIKDNLYASGAIYAAMSGTGSTIYGIFHGDNKPSLSLPSTCFIKWL